MTIKAFVWGPNFHCGIPIIDTQHERLVELINRLGDVITAPSDALYREIVSEVADYAVYHFRTEEAIWEGGLDQETLAEHQETHLEFVARLAAFASEFNGKAEERAIVLHSFLSSWLIFHILGDDFALARRIQNKPPLPVQEPVAAAENVFPKPSSRTEIVLLDAMRGLYTALTTVNSRLHETNKSLDARVRERTQALESANEALIQERDLLVRANTMLDDTRSRLLDSEKMASVGQLAAGVAHEINNPIGFVNSNLGTLNEYLDDLFFMLDTYAQAEPLISRDPLAIAAVRSVSTERDIPFVREDAKNLLQESLAGLSRVKNIVQDLKTFSHVDQVEWNWVDLRVGLESTINIIWHELRQKAELRREFGDTPKVLCNGSQINQVLMNLLMNAAQAIGDHGVIIVRTGTAKGEVWVEVEDDGSGISPEHQSRIFDPFFTTKPVGKGTGLGLSLAWGVAQKHGGRIELDSELGRGSRFRLCLPEKGPAVRDAGGES